MDVSPSIIHMLLGIAGLGVLILSVTTLLMVVETVRRDRRNETAWRREASRLVEAYREAEEKARLAAERQARAQEEARGAAEKAGAIVAATAAAAGAGAGRPGRGGG